MEEWWHPWEPKVPVQSMTLFWWFRNPAISKPVEVGRFFSPLFTRFNNHAGGGFPKIVVPQYGWFIMENPIKMDDLGEPPFKETPIYARWLALGHRLGPGGPGSRPLLEVTHQCVVLAREGVPNGFPDHKKRIDNRLHQGKSRWHSYLVLVYISHVLTYLLGTVPYILTMGYLPT